MSRTTRRSEIIRAIDAVEKNAVMSAFQTPAKQEICSAEPPKSLGENVDPARSHQDDSGEATSAKPKRASGASLKTPVPPKKRATSARPPARRANARQRGGVELPEDDDEEEESDDQTNSMLFNEKTVLQMVSSKSKPVMTNLIVANKLRSSNNAALRAALHAKKAARKRFIAENWSAFASFATGEPPSVESQPSGGNAQQEIVSQPSSVVGGSMRPYQLEGLRFLVRMYDSGVGCILGDEMGLGKTLQTISFLAYLKHVRKEMGPSLVVAPLSVLQPWMAEFRRWCPSLKVVKCHGPASERARILEGMLRDPSFDVVVTSYEMITVAQDVFTQFFMFRCLVLDEAQRTKNEQSQISLLTRKIRCVTRILISGTPFQNDMHELWSFLAVLLPEVFPSSAPFDKCFNVARDEGLAVHKLHQLSKLLAPVMLRRLKQTADLALPPKREVKVFVPLSPQQLELYQRLLKTNLQRASDGSEETVSSLYTELRKVCLHPLLCELERGDGSVSEVAACEELIEASGKLLVLVKLLHKLREEGHRVLLFCHWTSMLDLLAKALQARGFTFFRLDGSTNRVRRSLDIRRFSTSTATFCYIISTRAGGLGINLPAADTVIFYDSDFNPTMDAQAEDRAHRIGQTRPVTVYRLVTADTVEERIMHLAERKKFVQDQINERHQRHQIKAAAATKSGNANSSLAASAPASAAGAFVPTAAAAAASGVALTAELRADIESIDVVSGQGGGGTDSADSAGVPEGPSTGEAVGAGEGMGVGDIGAAVQFSAQRILRMTHTSYDAIKALDAESILSASRDMFSAIGDATAQGAGSEGEAQSSLLQQDSFQVAAALRPINRGADGELVAVKTDYSDTCDHWAQQLQAAGVHSSSRSARRAFEASAMQAEAQEEEVDELAVVPSRPTKKTAVFEHEDECLLCKEGEEGSLLYLCQWCPRVLHWKCAGLSEPPKNWFRCPQHECATCHRNTVSAGGLLFRCVVCPCAFCEDHYDGGQIELERAPELEALGFAPNDKAFFVVCSPTCAQYYQENQSHYKLQLGEFTSPAQLQWMRSQEEHECDCIVDHKQAARDKLDLGRFSARGSDAQRGRGSHAGDGDSDNSDYEDTLPVDPTFESWVACGCWKRGPLPHRRVSPRDKRWFVECRICSGFFHGECVGVSPEELQRLLDFVCTACTDPSRDWVTRFAPLPNAPVLGWSPQRSLDFLSSLGHKEDSVAHAFQLLSIDGADLASLSRADLADDLLELTPLPSLSSPVEGPTTQGPNSQCQQAPMDTVADDSDESFDVQLPCGAAEGAFCVRVQPVCDRDAFAVLTAVEALVRFG